jgi:hypothetical protein
MIFTTSWDDGYAGDMRIAELLDRHHAKGTFYVSPYPQHGCAMLSTEQVKSLDQRHEVGAHTLTHPHLSRIELTNATGEIRDSKQWVEAITGRPCAMFCYPYGDYNTAVRDAVEAAGFRGARTVESYRFTSNDPFQLPASLHIHPFPWRARFTRWWHPFDPLLPLRRRWSTLNALQIPLLARRSWGALARAMFLHALGSGQSFFHLWGHTYELDRYNSWGELDRFLTFISHYPVDHRTNGQLVEDLFTKLHENPPPQR